MIFVCQVQHVIVPTGYIDHSIGHDGLYRGRSCGGRPVTHLSVTVVSARIHLTAPSQEDGTRVARFGAFRFDDVFRDVDQHGCGSLSRGTITQLSVVVVAATVRLVIFGDEDAVVISGGYVDDFMIRNQLHGSRLIGCVVESQMAVTVVTTPVHFAFACQEQGVMVSTLDIHDVVVDEDLRGQSGVGGVADA